MVKSVLNGGCVLGNISLHSGGSGSGEIFLNVLVEVVWVCSAQLRLKGMHPSDFVTKVVSCNMRWVGNRTRCVKLGQM